jgi:hypothetical protein
VNGFWELQPAGRCDGQWLVYAGVETVDVIAPPGVHLVSLRCEDEYGYLGSRRGWRHARWDQTVPGHVCVDSDAPLGWRAISTQTVLDLVGADFADTICTLLVSQLRHARVFALPFPGQPVDDRHALAGARTAGRLLDELRSCFPLLGWDHLLASEPDPREAPRTANELLRQIGSPVAGSGPPPRGGQRDRRRDAG